MWLEKVPGQLGPNASALPVIYKSYEEEKWCVKNVRRMRSERVNLFFVSLFAWLRTFWRVPLRKFSRFRPLKISRERYQPIIMTGKSLPDVLSTALRPVEYAAAATYLLHNVPKQQKIVCFILLHLESFWSTQIHPDHMLVKFVFQNELR